MLIGAGITTTTRCSTLSLQSSTLSADRDDQDEDVAGPAAAAAAADRSSVDQLHVDQRAVCTGRPNGERRQYRIKRRHSYTCLASSIASSLLLAERSSDCGAFFPRQDGLGGLPFQLVPYSTYELLTT